ncbi:hypothetical protein G3N59_02045 [Paraburkholderia sp. Ac-20340]|uniref:hypothetical protein n=1 Tax=Paraburkholderia sp. Ac-20340 TaxID=2703888 RepID=UPI0019803DF6|nr:hypothetical protein [Paraburkholderia sp. Ac-20340]MBN3852153.1 hypothetical protein [Paraburkholderia sp. Ac-20340]
MNRRTRLRHAREAALLTRMEMARTELLLANIGLRLGLAAPRDQSLSIANLGRALAGAPRVTLLGSALLGTVVFGPKRVLPMMARSGWLGWIAHNVRIQSARSTRPHHSA